MSSTDGFKRLLFNAGEQAIVDDFNNLQAYMESKIRDFMFLGRIGNYLKDPTGAEGNQSPELINQAIGGFAVGHGLYPTDCAFCPIVGAGYVGPGGSNNSLAIQCAGPIVQFFSVGDLELGATLDPLNPPMLMYWMNQDDVLPSTAVGDATHDRIDLLQVKLSSVDGGATSRVYATPAVNASIALGSLTTHLNTVLQAAFGGADGNNLRFSSVGDGGGSHFFTQAGSSFTYHFTPGVTTVANFEADVALTGSFSVQTPGTPGNVLASPADVVTNAGLSGGVNQILSSLTVNKTRKIQGTYQIKQGTPAVTPTYPAPDAGFVPVAGIYVPQNNNAVHLVTNIRDMRWPLGGVRPYEVDYLGMYPDGIVWTRDDTNWRVVASGIGGGVVHAVCKAGLGRLVAYEVDGNLNSLGGLKLEQLFANSGAPTINILADNSGRLVTGFKNNHVNAMNLMDDFDATNAKGQRQANTRVGNPYWTTGDLNGAARLQSGGPPVSNTLSQLMIAFNAGSGSDYVYKVRFFVAHGLG